MAIRPKKLINIGYWALLVLLLVIACTSALSIFSIPSGIRLFVVQSGSMQPAIKTGSIVVVKKSTSYAKGDVITFSAKKGSDIKNPKNLITHRIIDIRTDNDLTSYITKGDANNVEDFISPEREQVLGKVIFAIPYLGYPVSYAKTQTGFIVLIVIPATLIVYSELLHIKNEAKRLMQERKKRKLTKTEELEEKVGEEIMEVEQDVKEMFKKKGKNAKA